MVVAVAEGDTAGLVSLSCGLVVAGWPGCGREGRVGALNVKEELGRANGFDVPNFSGDEVINCKTATQDFESPYLYFLCARSIVSRNCNWISTLR